MAIKTYAVYGLVEYEVNLKIGDKLVKAHFDGGSMTVQGIVPAKYTTGNEVIQYMLEKHPCYKSGRVKAVKVEEDANKERATKIEPQPEADEPKGDAPAFEQWEDAADYISEHYGIAKRQLRTKAAVEAAAKQYGVSIKD